ncbi:MAG: DegQ family serine endoprotease [candidate division NC10 bacterium]|nr:DegQ family serine endoprotease [candidate division NC10 bacterium]
MSDPSFRARGVSLPTVLLVAVISLAAGVLLAVAFGLTRPPTVQRFWSELQPPSAPQADVLLPGRPDSFATLVRRLKGTVVNINTTKRVRLPKDHPDVENPSPEKGEPRDFFDKFFGGRERDFNQRNMGSGVIIHPDGYIVTNDHVVDGTEAIQVRLSSGQQYRAEVVGTDSKTDLALIKIRADAPLPVATIGDSDKLEVGDWVLAIGNPFGFDHSVTAGIVSGKGRVLGSGPYDDFIQTDAAINPGNSGGPLFNTRGEVVGINTAIIPRSRFGFAIPSNMAKTVLLQLKARGKVTRGWLGVVIQQVTPPAADALGLRESQGALVSEVMVDSPAEKVGIRRGDVILRFRGKSVTEVRDLPRFVAETPVGAEVELDILRDGKSRTLHLRVGELREERLAQVHPQDPGFGLTVQDLTPELAKGLGVPEGQGVAVTRVAPGSASEEAGIRQGDVILEVNRKSVKTRDAFESVMRQRSGGSSLMFLVRRGDITRYIAMKGK